MTIGNPSQVLILTGHDGPFHNWRETSQVLKHVIERDGRLRAGSSTDPEFLAREDLLAYDLIVQNYVNWERAGLSDAAKKNCLKYLEAGRGLAVIHFANGAFHPSLPKAAEGDWPEYRKIVRRVWDHGKGLSGHDAFGKFQVEIAGEAPDHGRPERVRTVDELYYNQQGDETLEPLVTAKSKDTARTSRWPGRTSTARRGCFRRCSGHAAESIRGDGPATLIRRGCAWAAGRELTPEKPPAAKPVEKRLTLRRGQVRQGPRRPRVAGEHRGGRPLPQAAAHRRVLGEAELEGRVQRPRLDATPSRAASTGRSTPTPASGDFSAYLPGTLQGEIKLRRAISATASGITWR